MNNLITYKAGYSNLESTESWENSIETGGEGKSYGFELFIQKQRGKTTGWIGYTLSWSSRKFDNLNQGNWYPYKYDRRNDLSIVFNHKFNDKWDCGITWVFGTGNAIHFQDQLIIVLCNQEEVITSMFGISNHMVIETASDFPHIIDLILV